MTDGESERPRGQGGGADDSEARDAGSGAGVVDREIDGLFDDFDALLKNPEVGAVLAERGVNVSLAIVAADGLRALLKGDKARAVDDLGTVAEEVAARMRLADERNKATRGQA